MKEDKLEPKFDDIFEDLQSDLDSNIITYNEFCKKVVNLAYEAALTGFTNDAFYMILSLKPEYFGNQAILDFNEDPKYFFKGTFLFEMFKHNDWADVFIETTQKEAKA